MSAFAHSRPALADVEREGRLYRNLLNFLYGKPSTSNPMSTAAPVFTHREPRVRRFAPVVLKRPARLEPIAVNTGHPQPAHSPEPDAPVPAPAPAPVVPPQPPTEPAAPVETQQPDTAALPTS